METHKQHIHDLIQILLVKKRFFVVGVEIKLEDYTTHDTIAYLTKMFSYFDLPRVMTYGLDLFVQHLELLRILLKNLSCHLYDEVIFHPTMQLLHDIEEFLGEYSYDISKHSMTALEQREQPSFPITITEHHTESVHIFLQCLQYVLQASSAYLNLKRQCFHLLNILIQRQIPCSTDEIVHEIEECEQFIHAMEEVITIIQEICQKESDAHKRKQMFQEYYNCVNNKQNMILYGIAYSAV